jgi:hypothetical protein
MALSKFESQIKAIKDRAVHTVRGRIIVSDLFEAEPEPKGVLKVSKVEVRHKSVRISTIVVERFIDGEIHFKNNVVIRDLKKTEVTELAGEISTEYIRYPNCKGYKMPWATQAEVKRHGLEMAKKIM